MARQWFDQDGVDIIVDVPGSGVAPAVSRAATEKRKGLFHAGYSSVDLLGNPGSTTTIQWSLNLTQMADMVCATLAQPNGPSWFVIGPASGIGHDITQRLTRLIGGNGGKLVGSRSFDPGQTDYSSLIVDALSSGAKVLLLTAAGFPAIAAVRQFGEFTGHGKMRPVCPFLMMTDVDAIGLNAAQGALVCG